MNEPAGYGEIGGAGSGWMMEPPKAPKRPKTPKGQKGTMTDNRARSMDIDGSNLRSSGGAVMEKTHISCLDTRCCSVSSVISVFSVVPQNNPTDRSKGGYPRQKGFTLIEVLIALAVLTASMAALVQAGGTRADHVEYLRDRTLSHWIASDRVTAFRLAGEWPSPGVQEGETEMARRTWTWRAEISETPDPAVRRIEVAVGLEGGGEALSRVTGFLGDPGDRVR